MVPGVAIAMQGVGRCHALLCNQSFQRRKPMPVVGLAGVWIAAGLGTLDFAGKGGGPFVPGEQSALMQRQRHGKGLRLPGFVEHRAVIIARNPWHGFGRARGGGVHHAASKYGSNASIDIFTVGSASTPHSSTPSNTTV